MSHGARPTAADLAEQLAEIGRHLLGLVDLAERLDDERATRLRGVLLEISLAIGFELDSLADELQGAVADGPADHLPASSTSPRQPLA